jgi:hypothetical protein
VLTIELTGRGRRDIPSAAFDNRQPLQLDAGIRIIKILRVASEPPGRAGLPVVGEGSLLSVGPGLIARRQEITITVLAGGGNTTRPPSSPVARPLSSTSSC